MTKVLYVNASPSGDKSVCTQAANVFLEALDSSVEVDRINLFEVNLPDVTSEVASAKVKFVMGSEPTEEERRQWSEIERLVGVFLSADHYLFAVPMWNYSIPYKFKQYIDLVTYPGLTFTRGENGLEGLAAGPVSVIYSRGGNYAPKDGQPDPFDFQSPYMRAWFSLVGLGPANEILVQNTMLGPDAIAESLGDVSEELASIARALCSGIQGAAI